MENKSSELRDKALKNHRTWWMVVCVVHIVLYVFMRTIYFRGTLQPEDLPYLAVFAVATGLVVLYAIVDPIYLRLKYKGDTPVFPYVLYILLTFALSSPFFIEYASRYLIE